MSETLNQEVPPINVNPNQLTAAILCRLSGQPERFQVLCRRHKVTNYVVSGSSEHLQRTRIIRWDKDGGGWVTGSTHCVRLISAQGGKRGYQTSGTEIQILFEIFGPDRKFVIGHVYDLRELVTEARQRQPAA